MKTNGRGVESPRNPKNLVGRLQITLESLVRGLGFEGV
jgi:hypothetical protein